MKIKTFSRKTIAIAVAAGMSLGGVTVVAPTAGAVGGRTGEVVWYLDKEGNLISNTDPNSLISPSDDTVVRYPTWGIASAGIMPKGGYFENVPVIDAPAVSGFSSANDASGQKSAATAGSSAFPHGFQKEPMQVKDMATLDLGNGSTKESSMDAKKMYYVAFSIVNDIVKNEGLSPELKSRLKGYGYTGDFGKESAIDVDQSHYRWTGDGKITDDQLREGYLWKEGTNDSDGHTNFYSSGDYVASVVSAVAGAVDVFDHGNLSPDKPFSFEDVYAEATGDRFAFKDLVRIDNMSESDTQSLMYAMTQMARNVPDTAIEESDLVVHRAGGITGPPLFSLSESNPAPIEDLPKPEVEPETPATDLHITDVKKLDNGNYEVTRSDGKKWTIDLSDLNKRVSDLEAKESPSKAEFDNLKNDLKKAQDGINGLKGKDAETNKAIQGLRDDLNKLEPRVDKLEKRVEKLEKSIIKEVKDNGDGTYTLIREDGSKVKGKIDTGDNITKIVDNGDGSITVTHADGTTDKVTLAQTTVTETNKGKPNHTVTITTPDGKSVTLNVFDKHITNVKKLDNGNYEVTRNDGTKWTIDLKDIRDQIAELEKKESPSKADFDKVKKQLSDLTTKVNNDLGDIDDRFTKVEGDITNLRSDLTKLEKRVTKIESRLTKVEGRTDALTKCIAGAGTAGIPALLSVPLLLMTQLNIPGIKDLNTQVQKQIGIFNPQLSRQWERSGGVLQAGAALAGLAGMIGGVAYIANQCNPMMKTDAAKETDLGKLSSKIESGSSKDEAKPKDK